MSTEDNEGNLRKETKCKKNHDIKNSISEPDLATAGKDTLKSGFPPGITVDELWLYRRKRPSVNLWPQDNIKLDNGSFKPLKSEYKRRFKNYYQTSGSDGDLSIRREDLSPVRARKPEDTLMVEGVTEFNSEYNESFTEYPPEKFSRRKPFNSFEIIDSNKMDNFVIPEVPKTIEPLLTEVKSKFIKYSDPERPQLIKKPTNLKIEGDFYTITEQAEKFIEYLLTKRPDLARRATTLKLEGDMDIKTENREKFIPFEYQIRPPLCKKFTNLHLEGDLNIITEQKDKFKNYEFQKRPPLSKHETNLHIEGDLDLMPEYRREFREYKDTERPKLALPVNNLKTDGFYDVTPDVSKPFENQIHPQIPFLRGTDIALDDSRYRDRRFSNKDIEIYHKQDNGMQAITENKREFVEKPMSRTKISKAANNLLLEGRIDLNPEYRNAYIDYHKDGRISPIRAKSRRSSQYNTLKSEGKMEISPEYSCSYVNFPRERPRLRRPECSLYSEGEIDHTTEKTEKYVPYANVPRTESLKREPELKLEGHFECQPEYRKAYIDYLIREKAERNPRPLDNLGMPIKRAFEVVPSVTSPKIEKPIISIQPESLSGSQILVPVAIDSDLEKSSQKAQSTTSETTSSSVKSDISKNTVRKSPRHRNLLQLESTAFGQNLTVPISRRKSSSRSSSRATSPTPSTARRTTATSRSRGPSPKSCQSSGKRTADKREKKFGNSVKVENLAYKNSAPLPPTLLNVSARNRWMKDSSVDSTSSFVVLDNKEINNNYLESDKKRFIPSENVFCREQRWVPSWHDPPPLP